MTSPSNLPRGPIARKVVAQLRKAKYRKFVGLNSWAEAERATAELMKAISPKGLSTEIPPIAAAYSYVTNFATVLVELLLDLPELRRFRDRIERDEEEYMPEGPPMSPLTRTFFWHGVIWDLSFGLQRETLGSVLLAVGDALQMDREFLHLLDLLNRSRLGMHVHEGAAGGKVVLRELVTNERRQSICLAGYEGAPGELWLARVLPPPAPELAESVVVTTPYVILEPTVSEWERYLERTLARIAARSPADAYHTLMKDGLAPNYWSEYVFEAYANHVTEAIFLMGLPDVPESRPHSKVNSG
jgi:hypothetical protein